ncbi:MAG: RsmB/NOP family class I SAM-dependent RNA methyltransferase, partial [Bacteroidota bacterium]
MYLPPAFIEQMQNMLGSDFSDFEASLAENAPVSIRLNPNKMTRNWEAEQIAWHPDAYYLAERPVFTLDPSFHAGTYYVQEASSMFVAEAVKQLVDLDQPLRVLDLCAAPGGKSTLLLSLLNDRSFLLSNEVIKHRYHILQENLAKWGRSNVAISNHDPKDFKALTGFFDVVVVDAPCSGEGLFRKDLKARQEWSTNAVEHCAARQKRILTAAQTLVKPNGLLIYCTCTYNRQENDENVEWLTQNYAFQSEALSIPKTWNITERSVDGKHYYQFFPHRTKGEGFFLSCLRNTGHHSAKSPKRRKHAPKTSFEKITKSTSSLLPAFVAQHEDYDFLQDQLENIHAFPKALGADFRTLAQVLPRISLGTTIGTVKGKNLVPATPLAMSPLVSHDLPELKLNH